MVSELLRRSGSGVTVSVEANFPGGRLIGGKYAMDAHAVTMYTEVIKKQCLQLFGSLDSVNEYFMVVLAHELGHAGDTSLPELCSMLDSAADEQTCREIALRIEENAWHNAMPWIRDLDPGFVQIIIDQSLEAYREDLAPVTA